MEACNITQATCRAVVCGTMCLQAACKRRAYRSRLTWRHSAIYSTLPNNSVDLWEVAYELNIVQVTHGHSTSHTLLFILHLNLQPLGIFAKILNKLTRSLSY